jgi:hypothetical protein
VRVQRELKKKGILSAERIARLVMLYRYKQR